LGLGECPSDFVAGGIADERVAGADVEVDVGERFDGLAGFELGGELEEEAEFADFHGFLHDVHAVEIVDDDGLVDEVGLVRVAIHGGEDGLDFLFPNRVLFTGGLPIGEQGAEAFEQAFVERF